MFSAAAGNDHRRQPGGSAHLLGDAILARRLLAIHGLVDPGTSVHLQTGGFFSHIRFLRASDRWQECPQLLEQ